MIAPTEQKFWERFCDALELPAAWRARGSWNRVEGDPAYDEEEKEELTRRFASRPREEWMTILGAADIPVSQVLDYAEAMNSEHRAANQVLQPIDVRSRRFIRPRYP